MEKKRFMRFDGGDDASYEASYEATVRRYARLE
jgi:hypothetical protein